MLHFLHVYVCRRCGRDCHARVCLLITPGDAYHRIIATQTIVGQDATNIKVTETETYTCYDSAEGPLSQQIYCRAANQYAVLLYLFLIMIGIIWVLVSF